MGKPVIIAQDQISNFQQQAKATTQICNKIPSETSLYSRNKNGAIKLYIWTPSHLGGCYSIRTARKLSLIQWTQSSS
jgi:hypothetical protein